MCLDRDVDVTASMFGVGDDGLIGQDVQRRLDTTRLNADVTEKGNRDIGGCALEGE